MQYGIQCPRHSVCGEIVTRTYRTMEKPCSSAGSKQALGVNAAGKAVKCSVHSGMCSICRTRSAFLKVATASLTYESSTENPNNEISLVCGR